MHLVDLSSLALKEKMISWVQLIQKYSWVLYRGNSLFFCFHLKNNPFIDETFNALKRTSIVGMHFPSLSWILKFGYHSVFAVKDKQALSMIGYHKEHGLIVRSVLQNFVEETKDFAQFLGQSMGENYTIVSINNALEEQSVVQETYRLKLTKIHWLPFLLKRQSIDFLLTFRVLKNVFRFWIPRLMHQCFSWTTRFFVASAVVFIILIGWTFLSSRKIECKKLTDDEVKRLSWVTLLKKISPVGGELLILKDIATTMPKGLKAKSILYQSEKNSQSIRILFSGELRKKNDFEKKVKDKLTPLYPKAKILMNKVSKAGIRLEVVVPTS